MPAVYIEKPLPDSVLTEEKAIEYAKRYARDTT